MSSSDFGPGPEETVKATANLTSRMKEMMESARKDPSRELGITKEELEQRKKLASAPRSYVSEKTSRAFDVKSSARAQQIMNRGLLSKQREMRNREVAKKMGVLRKVRVGVFFAGVGLMWWVGIQFLLPHYVAVQERNKRMQIRFERSQMKLEELAKASDSKQCLGS